MPAEESPIPTRRRWAVIVIAVALGGGVLFSGGWWAAGHLSSASSNSGTAAAGVDELKASAALRAREIATLQNEVCALQAGTRVEQQILQIAGTAILAFAAQQENICKAIPGCVVIPFSLGSPSTTTTTTVPRSGGCGT